MVASEPGTGPLHDPPGAPGALPPARRAPRVTLLFLALSLLFAVWIQPLGATLDPTARDQVHDLSLALRIRQGTALSDGNRHPLLPALLAPVARREAGFFEDAWELSVVLSAISLLAVGLAAARVFGGWVALGTLVVFAFELRLQARRVCPEPLVAGLLALAAATLAVAPRRRRPLLGFLAAGAWTGAAWLAKGSALLSLGAAALAVFGLGVRAAPRRLGALLVGFVVVASPLLAWNLSEGHAPTFNVNSAHVMWEDAWDEGLDLRSTATASAWFARHGPTDALARLARGLVAQRGVEWVYLFLGAVSLAAWAGRKAPGRAEAAEPCRVWRLYALGTAALWLPAFAWYAPLVASRRLLFPCFAVLLPPTWEALGRVLEALAPRAARTRDRLLDRAAGWTALAAGLVVAAALAWVLLRPASKFRGVDSVAQAVARDLPALLPPNERVRIWMRPSRTIPPDWLIDDHVVICGLPSDATPALVRTADAILLNEGVLGHRPAALAPWGRWDDSAGVVLDPSVAPSRVLARWPATGRASFVLVALPGGG